MEDKTVCNSRTIHEELLQQAFVDALNEMIENSDGYLSHLKENLKTDINLCNPQSAEALAARMNPLMDCVFSVSGDSMEPDFHNGDLVMVQRLSDRSDLYYGEIGAFSVRNESQYYGKSAASGHSWQEDTAL